MENSESVKIDDSMELEDAESVDSYVRT